MKIKASSDELQLSVMVKAPSEPKAIVQIVHGMCEHKERYMQFMDFLVSKGYACVIHDHRGHGESVKKTQDLGYMYKGGWKAMVEDVKVVNQWIKSQYPGRKCILFGHSMGSLVVRSYAKRYDDTIDELFVCGCPSYNWASVVAKWICRLLMLVGLGHHRPKLIQFLAFDSFNKPFKDEGYSSAWVCSDIQTLEAYHKDPLCQFIFTSNGFYNLFGLMQDCYSDKGWGVKNPNIPVHFISGTDDPCRISDKAFDEAVAKMKKHYDVDSRLFEGMRHEILNETKKQAVYDYICSAFHC